MLLGFGYLYELVMFILFLFFKKKAENNRLKKPVDQNLVILLLLLLLLLFLLKMGSVGPVEQQINFISPDISLHIFGP